MDRKPLASKCVWGNDIFMFYNRALWNDTGFGDRGVQYNALVDNKTLNTKSKCIVHCTKQDQRLGHNGDIT